MGDILGFDNSTVHSAPVELGKVQKYGAWISKELSEYDETRRFLAAKTLIRMYDDSKNSPKPLFTGLITGDEKWVLYTNINNRKEWVSSTKQASPRINSGLHPKKILLFVWWDVRGVIYFELLKQNETMNSEKYVPQLQVLNQKIRN